jgi:hypothetical protein
MRSLNEYNLLGTMLSFPDGFTVTDLVRFTGMNENSIRTCIQRHPDLIEKVNQQRTGRPGGQVMVYRIKPDHLASIRERLERDFRVLTRPHPSPIQVTAGVRDEPSPLPLSLRVAEDDLRHKFAAAESTQAKVGIFELAQIRLETARTEVKRILAKTTDITLGCRLAAVEAINNIRATELEVELAASSASSDPITTSHTDEEHAPLPEKAVQLANHVDASRGIADDLHKHGENDAAIAVLDTAVNSAANALKAVAAAGGGSD